MKKQDVKTIQTTLRLMRFKKGCSDEIQLYIDEQIKELMLDPEIGFLQKGDLKGIRAHTFEYKKKEYNILYSFARLCLRLLQIGTQENYSRVLRQLLR